MKIARRETLLRIDNAAHNRTILMKTEYGNMWIIFPDGGEVDWVLDQRYGSQAMYQLSILKQYKGHYLASYSFAMVF